MPDFALEAEGLLTSTEQEDLLPGREMSRIRLADVIGVVRDHGETGSYRDPKWAAPIDGIGDSVDAAVAATIGDQTLAGLLDATEKPGGD